MVWLLRYSHGREPTRTKYQKRKIHETTQWITSVLAKSINKWFEYQLQFYPKHIQVYHKAQRNSKHVGTKHRSVSWKGMSFSQRKKESIMRLYFHNVHDWICNRNQMHTLRVLNITNPYNRGRVVAIVITPAIPNWGG